MSLEKLMGIKFLYEIVSIYDPKRVFLARSYSFKLAYPFVT
jgi:hypothetical protein